MVFLSKKNLHVGFLAVPLNSLHLSYVFFMLEYQNPFLKLLYSCCFLNTAQKKEGTCKAQIWENCGWFVAEICLWDNAYVIPPYSSVLTGYMCLWIKSTVSIIFMGIPRDFRHVLDFSLWDLGGSEKTLFYFKFHSWINFQFLTYFLSTLQYLCNGRYATGFSTKSRASCYQTSI